MSEWTLYFDGLCEPRNPGGTMVWAFCLEAGESSTEQAKAIPPAPANTNNVSEWLALGFALKHISEQATVPSNLRIFGDSQLVVNQLNRTWQCKKEHLGKLRDRCLELLKAIGVPWKATWIPREENKKADDLGRAAYFQATGKQAPERGKR